MGTLRQMMGVGWLMMGFACESKSWSNPDACAALSSGPKQDECWAATLPALFRTDRTLAEQLTRERVSDARVRDYIWLTVTRDVDPGSYRYCELIQDKALADRCKVLVSRPHLHRELTGKQQGSNAPRTPETP